MLSQLSHRTLSYNFYPFVENLTPCFDNFFSFFIHSYKKNPLHFTCFQSKNFSYKQRRSYFSESNLFFQKISLKRRSEYPIKNHFPFLKSYRNFIFVKPRLGIEQDSFLISLLFSSQKTSLKSFEKKNCSSLGNNRIVETIYHDSIFYPFSETYLLNIQSHRNHTQQKTQKKDFKFYSQPIFIARYCKPTPSGNRDVKRINKTQYKQSNEFLQVPNGFYLEKQIFAKTFSIWVLKNNLYGKLAFLETQKDHLPLAFKSFYTFHTKFEKTFKESFLLSSSFFSISLIPICFQKQLSSKKQQNQLSFNFISFLNINSFISNENQFVQIFKQNVVKPLVEVDLLHLENRISKNRHYKLKTHWNFLSYQPFFLNSFSSFQNYQFSSQRFTLKSPKLFLHDEKIQNPFLIPYSANNQSLTFTKKKSIKTQKFPQDSKRIVISKTQKKLKSSFWSTNSLILPSRLNYKIMSPLLEADLISFFSIQTGSLAALKPLYKISFQFFSFKRKQLYFFIREKLKVKKSLSLVYKSFPKISLFEYKLFLSEKLFEKNEQLEIFQLTQKYQFFPKIAVKKSMNELERSEIQNLFENIFEKTQKKNKLKFCSKSSHYEAQLLLRASLNSSSRFF